MNNDIKLSLTVALPGRAVVSRVAETQSNPQTKQAKQVINITKDSYDYMTSHEAPWFMKSNRWKMLNKKQKLEAHLKRICEDLGGTSYNYKIFTH